MKTRILLTAAALSALALAACNQNQTADEADMARAMLSPGGASSGTTAPNP